jgi:hypothetical protein
VAVVRMLEQVTRLERRQRNERWALRYKYVFRVVGTASKNSLDQFFPALLMYFPASHTYTKELLRCKKSMIVP